MLPRSFTSKPGYLTKTREISQRFHLPAFRVAERQLTGSGQISHSVQLFHFTVQNKQILGQFQWIIWVNYVRSPDIIHNLRSMLYFELIAGREGGGREKLVLTQEGGVSGRAALWWMTNVQTQPSGHPCVEVWSYPILPDFRCLTVSSLEPLTWFLLLSSFPVDLRVKGSEMVRGRGPPPQESPGLSDASVWMGPPWRSSQ